MGAREGGFRGVAGRISSMRTTTRGTAARPFHNEQPEISVDDGRRVRQVGDVKGERPDGRSPSAATTPSASTSTAATTLPAGLDGELKDVGRRGAAVMAEGDDAVVNVGLCEGVI